MAVRLQQSQVFGESNESEHNFFLVGYLWKKTVVVTMSICSMTKTNCVLVCVFPVFDCDDSTANTLGCNYKGVHSHSIPFVNL